MLVKVERIDEKEVTVLSSLDVAETFGKQHKDVMDNIRNIEVSVNGSELPNLYFDVLYKQSNAVEKELEAKRRERQKGIIVRKEFIKTLELSHENDRMYGRAYPTYTNLIYKTLFGKDVKQLRKQYDISSEENIRDYFNEKELIEVRYMEILLTGLLRCSWNYEKIKSFIQHYNTQL